MKSFDCVYRRGDGLCDWQVFDDHGRPLWLRSALTHVENPSTPVLDARGVAVSSRAEMVEKSGTWPVNSSVFELELPAPHTLLSAITDLTDTRPAIGKHHAQLPLQYACIGSMWRPVKRADPWAGV